MKNKLHYLLLSFILLCSLFFRVYRMGDLLGFYFDQGRDALVIWDFIHSHKFFLIGPTTGIEGIFLGPFYYYLLIPLYWIGKGNPVTPGIFFGILNAISTAGVYYLAQKYFNKLAGLFSSFFMAFSYYAITDHRWLSNPNPLTLTSILIYLFLLQLLKGKNWSFPIVCLLIGVSLQFEAASAVFFIPSLLITLFVFRKNIRLSLVQLFVGLISFAATLLPQLYFDYRHGHILLQAFTNFLITNRSFTNSPVSIFGPRLLFFFQSTSKYFFMGNTAAAEFFWVVLLGVGIAFRKKLLLNPLFKIILIWWLVPMSLLLLYTGNHGYVWGYYFTGVYPLLFILIGTLISLSWQSSLVGKILVACFVYFFLTINVWWINDFFTQPLTDKSLVVLGTSLSAVDWVYQDAGNSSFNFDVYVPPVIPHSYNYLFLWRGTTKYHVLPSSELSSLLYTLKEPDGEHPQYLSAWEKRQDTIGNLTNSDRFGGVTVEKRTRIKTTTDKND
jgi:4-amino-4-deoxy-L-arabinose transferase-like glycosyltransferase